MKYKSLNEKNKNLMNSEMNNDLNFEWEDAYLLDEIIRKYDDLYPFSSDPQEFINDKYYLSEINRLFNSLFKRKISKEKYISKLNSILKELLNKYPSLSYQYKYDIERYKEKIAISNRLIISGSGGIGKSYFIYKLEEKLAEYNLDHICIYGKFNDEISQSIFDEVKNVKKDFYFIIDALNEFNQPMQIFILDNLRRVAKNKNINIIVTYRTSSLDAKIIHQLKTLLVNCHEFKGVEFESSLLKMIETYGIDSVKYLDVIESNNPSQLKMLDKILFSTKLTNEEIGSLVQITFIYEQYIKNVCGKDNWVYIKEIGKQMLYNESEYIEEKELLTILGDQFEQFINITRQNNFIDVYEADNIKRFFFTTQHIADYIIARPLFEIISNKSVAQIVDIINKKLKKIPTISESVIVLLFDKFKKKGLSKAIKIIEKSDLKKNFKIDILRKINLEKHQIKEVQSLLKYNDNRFLFMTLGGCPNRPFNCTNYLNDIFFRDKDYQYDLLVRFYEFEYILHLKNIIYTLPFLNNENEYLEEYFNYSFWLTSVSNERIRKLAIKCMYDISSKNSTFEKKLINYYKQVDELYIKKAIIHVLTCLPRNKRITRFINTIYRDANEIDAEIIQRTAYYLNKNSEYQLANKKNINDLVSSNAKVDTSFNLNRIIWTADIYEKYLLKFEMYSEENTLSLHPNFIINNTKEINNYNKDLNRKFSCVKKGYCKYSMNDKPFKKQLNILNIVEFDKNRMFILFQEIFKNVSKKYNYDYLKEERFDEHLNKFENSLLRKILLLSQDILLGSFMTNYYTNDFCIYNDDRTFGYKNFSYIDCEEEKIYLTSPVSPYNELVDKLNIELSKRIGLYNNKNYSWYKGVNNSVNNCVDLTKPVILNNDSWSLVGGSFHLFIDDYVNEYYSCYMSINSKRHLIGDDNSRYMTIENEKYFGNVNDYSRIEYDKNMDIPNFESFSKDIKETNTAFPPPLMVRLLNLKYNYKTSSWNDSDGNVIILCDNNPKHYYKYPVSGAIYIKTSVLEKLKENNKIMYWSYTEKLYKKYGWNDKASLHIEIDSNSHIICKFHNNSLTTSKEELNNNCENCKFGIYQKSQLISKENNYEKLIDIINDLEY